MESKRFVFYFVQNDYVFYFRMYLAGIDAQLSTIYPKIEYPVTRGTKTLSTLIHWEHGEKWRAGLEDKLNYLASVRDLNISLKNEEYKHLVDNQQKNTIIIPTSTYLVCIKSYLLWWYIYIICRCCFMTF